MIVRTFHQKPTSRTVEHRKGLKRKRIIQAVRIREQLQELPEREAVRDLPCYLKF